MRKYARALYASGDRPIHKINPATAETYCQIENNWPMYARSGGGRVLKKFDNLPHGVPMCRNCEGLAPAHDGSQKP